MTNTNGTTNGQNGEKGSSPLAPFPIPSAPYPTFMNEQPLPIGSLLPGREENKNPPKLFTPLTIRGVEWPNRMWVAPMCMYSSDDGHATDWHMVHLSSMATRGWGNVMVEATAVLPEGRISPKDMGIWKDSHIEPLKRIVDFVHANGGKIGIQLAHAGRKAGTLPPFILLPQRMAGWHGGEVVPESNGGWPDDVWGPSDVSYNPATNPMPKEADEAYIAKVKQAFKDATIRAKKAGFDYVEVHGAHRYWMHSWCSPISNTRTDQYGGSFENRIKLPLELTQIVRDNWDGPLLYRVSATDWLESVDGPEKAHPGEKEEWAWWGPEQTTLLAAKLRDIGVDLLDVSSGGNDPRGKIDVGPGYQVFLAERIKREVPGLLVGAVGLITDAKQAEEVLQKDQADVVLFGRQVLNNIDFPLRSALDLGVAASPAAQYNLGWTAMTMKMAKFGIPRT